MYIILKFLSAKTEYVFDTHFVQDTFQMQGDVGMAVPKTTGTRCGDDMYRQLRQSTPIKTTHIAQIAQV